MISHGTIQKCIVDQKEGKKLHLKNMNADEIAYCYITMWGINNIKRQSLEVNIDIQYIQQNTTK